jgi:hypothetical protein
MKYLMLIPLVAMLFISCEKEEPHLLTFDCWYSYEGGWGEGPHYGQPEPPTYYVLHVEVTLTKKGDFNLYIPDHLYVKEESDDDGWFYGSYGDCGDTSVTVTLPNGESAVHGAYHDNH